MDLGLTDKVALVTGSYRGTGAGIARSLAGEGAVVLVHGLEPGQADKTAASILVAGDRALTVAGDIRTEEGTAAMIADVPELGQEGIIDMPWSPPKLDAKASGSVNYPIKDFYLTNAICRASPTMRRCSEELVQGREYLEAAE